MVLAMAASMPSLSRVASRLLASNQSLASEQQGAEHHEQHHLRHQSDVAHAPLQRVQLHNFSPFNVHYSFAVIAIGIIFLFINLHRA